MRRLWLLALRIELFAGAALAQRWAYKPLVQPSVEQERLRRLAYGERLWRLLFNRSRAVYKSYAFVQAG